LALGLKPEAQCAVAVLQRKFPDSPWSHQAIDALKSAGLEPAEDQKSCISPAFERQP
jgi:outer membrane protein assembly factor BamD (BamD/ComL family)